MIQTIDLDVTLVLLPLQVLTVAFLRLNHRIAYEASVRVRWNGRFNLLVLTLLSVKLVKMSLPLLAQLVFVAYYGFELFFGQKHRLSQRHPLAVHGELRND